MIDYFSWEALYRAHDLYAPEMFAGGSFDDESIQAEMLNDTIARSFPQFNPGFGVHL